MKLVFASENKNKIAEISKLLNEFDVEVKSLKDFDLKGPIENGKDFFENSFIKAKNAFDLTGLPSLGDDSGFCVDSMGDFPGLCSARFAESVGGYDEAFRVINDCINPSNKKVHFVTAMTYIYKKDDKVEVKTFDGRIDGRFTYPAKGTNGFGYCPVFTPDGYSETFAELPNEVRVKINHRRKALQKFLEFFKSVSL